MPYYKFSYQSLFGVYREIFDRRFQIFHLLFVIILSGRTETVMKIKENFLLRKVAGQNVVVPTGNNVTNFNAAITLNETAAFLWQLLEKGCEKETLFSELTEKYDVSQEIAQRDIDVFINVLKEHDILE